MQIKTVIWYHFTPRRMPITKKTDENKGWRGYGENGTLTRCWWEWKIVQPLWKSVSVPQKVKYRAIIWPSSSILSYIPKKIENTHSWKSLYTNVHGSVIHNSQKVKTTQMCTSWWTDNQNMAYLCNGIFFSHKMKFWSMLQHRWILKTLG